MKKYLSLFVLMLSFLPLICLADERPVKMETLDLGQLASGRPATINLWFPSGSCYNQTSRFCLTDTAVTHKTVIFSHGSMGSAEDYAWIGEHLAAAGFIVVGVNHFGESRTYGAHTQNMRSVASIWQRPQDISALLDRLPTEQLFQVPVDWNKVIAVGHSAGGQTASMLAGATFDLHQLTRYCDSESARGDRSCNYGGNRAQAPEQFVKRFNGQYQDARIKKIVLLDPAIGAAAQLNSLQKIRLPSLVVGAPNKDFLPWENHGKRYASAMPQAKTILLTEQAGHFVFLSPCYHPVRVMDVPLCEDRAGVDRKAVQQNLAREIIEFVRIDNEPATIDQQAEKHSSARSGGLLDILLYTPRWVFFLLAGLCVFGLMQARTRQVSMSVALILPAAMLMLSLSGVLRYVGLQLPALSCWLLGVAAITILCLKFINSNMARYDAATRKLTIQGSWIPLLVILGIFFTRYAMGVTSAMQFSWAQTWYFPLAVSLLLGAWSGFFLARGIVFWRASRG